MLLALLMAFVGVVVFVAGGAIATGAIALSAGTSLAWVVTTLVVAAGVAGVAFLYVFGFGLFAIFTALVYGRLSGDGPPAPDAAGPEDDGTPVANP
ncbi:MAG: hypothetical protein RIL09_07385 [Alphaproteobacteria bacterium]